MTQTEGMSDKKAAPGAEKNVESNESDSMAHGDDRRHDIRVQDAVGLHLFRPEDAAVTATNTDVSDAHALPRTKVRRSNKYSIAGYASVRRDHPDVIAYIDELEERIRQLLLDGDPIEAGPTHKISLSIGGMAFADSRLFEPGDVIGVSLTLFPSGRRIGCDAQIVSANDAPEIANGDRPNYRLVFVGMSDADRRALERHVNALSSARKGQGFVKQ